MGFIPSGSFSPLGEARKPFLRNCIQMRTNQSPLHYPAQRISLPGEQSRGAMASWTARRCWITNAAIPGMLGPAKIYFIIFGALTIVGGVIGYVKAGSVPSIVAGVITGVLLLAAGFLLPEHRVAGLTIALITSLLLAGQFIPKFVRTGKAMPAGMMSILSAIGLVMAIVAWLKK
jgi:uncharacterized membrane protein (UPF0136 family)